MTAGPTFERDRDGWKMPAIGARDNCGLGDPYLTSEGVATDMVIPDHLRGADSMLALGSLAVLADSAIGFATVASLDRPTGMATSHLHLEIVRPSIEPDVGRLRCTGRLVHDDGHHYALGHGTIFDDAGRPVAHASIGAVLLPFRTIQSPTDGNEPDPSTTVRESEPDRERRWSDVDEFLGSRRAPAGVMTFVASPTLANSSRGLHGGIGVFMAEQALQHALDSDGPHRFTLVELRATYPRPIAANGAPITCRSSITYRGRRLVTVRSELLDQRGKVAVVVDGTFIAAGGDAAIDTGGLST
jgi:acyl-coenzyme A thioesterase PaaI-like protein